VLVVGSVIGLYYYLRIIVAMATRPEEEMDSRPQADRLPGRTGQGGQAWHGNGEGGGLALPLTGGVTLAVVGLVVLWLGVYPTPLLELIEKAAAGLF